MTTEFKLGDKVTCLVHGKGVIVDLDTGIRPYGVCFLSGKAKWYRASGKYDSGLPKTLYHGHGTFKIEFVEDKEPEYEWQWLYFNGSYYTTTSYYKDEKDLMSSFTGIKLDQFKRIEESKREIKS